MRKIFLIIFIVLLLPAQITASEKDLKKSALELFEMGKYSSAVDRLREAERVNSDDPEVYYYLGYFTHYLCYDSVPLTGFNMDKSEQVLTYLKRAVELDPDYGNAYYFIGAECGARGRMKLMNGDTEGAREEFRRGRSLGGYPDWLLEFGRNILKSCSRGAILFLGGDADTNPIEYLQLVERYRTDVTAIPVALMSRPWFIKLVKRGVEDALPPVPISWSNYQIMNMHNYKWKANPVQAGISQEVRAEYGIEKAVFSWELKPDISDGLISAGTAAIADVIISNGFSRDIYFSLSCGGINGLDVYMQLCGMAMKLVPFETSGTGFEVDTESARKVLLEPENFSDLPGVEDTGMPRISGILTNYPAALIRLCGYHIRRGEKEKGAEIFELIDRAGMKEYIKIGKLESHLEMYRKMTAE